MMSNKKIILKVKNLDVLFKVKNKYFKAIDNISFDVENGDFYGVIGESGSGKSTTGKAIIKLYQPTGGSIVFDDKMISPKKISKSTKKWMKKNIQMIFQDPMSSMNPIKNVLSIISEPLIVNKIASKEALQFIKQIQKVKKYFHYRFNEKNFQLKTENLKDFYLKKNDIFNKFIHKINEINFSEIKHFDNFIEIISEINDELISELSEKLDILYNLEKIQKKEIETTIEKFNNNDLEPIDLELKQIDEKIFIKEIEVKYSSEYFLKKNEIKNLINNTKIFISDFNNLFSMDINSYKNEILKNFLIDYKSNVISKNSSNNKMVYLNNFIYEKINKEKYFLTKKLFKEITNNIDKYRLIYAKYKYSLNTNFFLSFEKIDELNLLINKIIDEKYNVMLNKILSLQKDFAKSKIVDRGNFLDNIENIKKEVEQLFKNRIQINETKIFENYFLIQKNNFQSFIKTVCGNFNLIREKKIELKAIKQNRLHDNQKKHNNEIELSHLLRKKIDILTRRKKIIHDFKNFLSKEKPKRKKIILDNKSNLKKGFNLEKNYNKIIYKNFKNIFFNLLKQQEGLLSKIKFISLSYSHSKSLKDKILSRECISFAYRSIISQFKRNTYLYNAYSFFSYLFFFSLRSFLIRQKVYESLISVGLQPEHAYRYPHEFSGGQRQRIVIARSLITNPKLVIADEPISALDVSIQSQVVNIMKKLAKQKGITFIFIAHDLSMVNYACNRVIIMHNGKIVEKGDVNLIFEFPIHPYTKSLLNAVPELSKIHVNLSNFSDKLDYYKNYNFYNKPSFFQYKNQDHYVFCTEEQFNQWTKKILKVHEKQA